MVTDTTPVLEEFWMARGRKLTLLKNEMLHHINAGETALARFLHGYIIAALSSSTDGDYTLAHIATESVVSAWAECHRFRRECATDLCHLDDERAGRNFWLTRNHHEGNGFLDECVFDEAAQLSMQQLTNASHGFGAVDFYLGDDRKLHFSNEGGIV